MNPVYLLSKARDLFKAKAALKRKTLVINIVCWSLILPCVVIFCPLLTALAQEREEQQQRGDEEFGPVVRAYLGYLRSEQEVVDDRVSRREISRAYYLRNSNRIRALRQIALRIARENHNDYLPELEAAARDEFSNLFEHLPNPHSLRTGEIINNTFRYLGAVRAGEIFYIFARLDPYEQADLMQKSKAKEATHSGAAHSPPAIPSSPQPPARTPTAPPSAAGEVSTHPQSMRRGAP